LKNQIKPQKKSKSFNFGIFSLVGVIVCLVYVLGYYHGRTVDKKVITQVHDETEKMSHNGVVNQSEDEKKNSLNDSALEGKLPPPFGSSFSVNSAVNLEMLWVEPGTFMMGMSPTTESGRSPSESQHQVTLTKGFYLGKYEVTQAQYEAVMTGNTNGLSATPSEWPNNPNRPVEKVSWIDIQIFLTRLNFQESGDIPAGWAYVLPTEAEWEYACRAGTTTAYHWGNSISPSNANYGRNIGETQDIGQYSPNAWGFYDMHGNVWEWTADYRYNKGNPTGNPVVDPTGPASGSFPVARGGSWSDDGNFLRPPALHYGNPSIRNDNYGIRIGFKQQ
jgi:formylglycine-generating enzyme required for sulfatase activity